MVDVDWMRQEVAGKACDVFCPSTAERPDAALLYLHDVVAAQPPLSACWTDRIRQEGLCLVAPYTGHSWWSDRVVPSFDPEVAPERFLMESVIPWVRENWLAGQGRFAVVGTGMGGQAALRLAYKYPDIFPVAAGVAPDLDFQFRIAEGDEVLYALYGSREAARQDTPILHIHPLNWPRHQFFCCDPEDTYRFEGVDRLRMKLGSIGIPYTCDVQISPPQGRTYEDTISPVVLDHITLSLDQERKRMV